VVLLSFAKGQQVLKNQSFKNSISACAASCK